MRQVVALATVACFLAAGPLQYGSSAEARSQPPGPRAVSISGTVQSVGRRVLLVRTRSGLRTVRFDLDTHVTRQVVVGRRGLYIDVRIRLRLVPGTRTATEIVIAREVGLGVQSTATASLCARRPARARTRATQAIGQIVRIRQHSLTVRACGGYRWYRLAARVIVRQTRLGRLADLRRGELVSVAGPAGGPARAILIRSG